MLIRFTNLRKNGWVETYFSATASQQAPYCNRTATQLVQDTTQRITELFEKAQNRINKLD